MVVRRLIPSRCKRLWAYFHLRPAPTERARVRETARGLKERQKTQTVFKRSSSQRVCV